MAMLLVSTFNIGFLVAPPYIAELAKITPLPLLGVKASWVHAMLLLFSSEGDPHTSSESVGFELSELLN